MTESFRVVRDLFGMIDPLGIFGGNEMALDKNKALETALSQIEKQFGKGAVMRLGENKHMSIDHISTGSLSLDIALGIGGLPRGRIVEIYGPESSGKTTLSLHCIAEGQKNGGNVAFIDVEHALDPNYAEALGVDVDSLLVSQPDTGEDALEIAEALIRSGAIDGRQPCGTSRKADVAGSAKACRRDQQVKLRGNIHQPASRKGGSCLRKPRGNYRRPRAEILQLGENRYQTC